MWHRNKKKLIVCFGQENCRKNAIVKPSHTRSHNIKMDLKIKRRKGVKWINLASCEQGNEPSVSVKCGKFLDQLSNYRLVMKLVRK
jgi:hypothetical protein